MSKLILVSLIIICLFCGCKTGLGSLSIEHHRKLYELFNNLYASADIHKRVPEPNNYYDSYELQDLRSVLGGVNSIIKAGQDDYFIDQQVAIIDNVVNSARITYQIPENISGFKDDFKGWISMDSSQYFGEEIVLNEAYSFFYIAEFLFYMLKSGWVNQSSDNRTWWSDKVDFVEKHIWLKWYSRSLRFHGNPHRYFLRSRVHMGSHWAGIAMYLQKITRDPLIQKQCEELYLTYDTLLKRNLNPHPLRTEAYIWNSTYDDVSGTFAVEVDKSLVQDVSHGNHVVSYIIAAYELGNGNWKLTDIRRMSNTVKILYDEDNNRFADLLDGTENNCYAGRGNFQADGWVKLAHYDEDVRKIYSAFAKDQRILKKYRQDFQFWGNFLSLN